MIQITRIFLINGEKSEPIEVDKKIQNEAHLKVYRNMVQQVMSKRKGHPVTVNFELKETNH